MAVWGSSSTNTQSSGEALNLLVEKKLSIESIAMLLGYSEVSNFRYACRRWFGQSPQAQRERLLAQGAG